MALPTNQPTSELHTIVPFTFTFIARLGNPVEVLSGLEGLGSMMAFTLNDGKLTSLSGCSATALETLYAENNEIVGTEGIEGATALVSVFLRGNKLVTLNGFTEAHEKLTSIDLRYVDLLLRFVS